MAANLPVMIPIWRCLQEKVPKEYRNMRSRFTQSSQGYVNDKRDSKSLNFFVGDPRDETVLKTIPIVKTVDMVIHQEEDGMQKHHQGSVEWGYYREAQQDGNEPGQWVYAYIFLE
ncbi:hypothetical protein MMC20_007101 [Loxospora ochrophaea]|nr:hypothetical protein [Loxospora ochrophaea]